MNSIYIPRIISKILCLICLGLTAQLAYAQYPCPVIKIISPYPPGGASDVLARMLVAGLSKQLNVSVIVENKAGASGNIDQYMAADQELDHVNHAACGNHSAVKAVVPLVVQCRRFWYRYQAEGEISEGARFHMVLAEAIASGHEAQAADGASQLMDYLERFARRVIDV